MSDALHVRDVLGEGALVIDQGDPSAPISFAVHDEHGRITGILIPFDELPIVISRLEFYLELGTVTGSSGSPK